MKITNEHIGRLLAARLERIQRAGRTADGGGLREISGDSATFSAAAEDLRVGLAAARTPARGPEAAARETKLSLLREQVRGGTYRVSAEAAAEALLRDLRRT
jgi:anti-sigma28 factor (negative regulator of flagellin synthesis)